MAIEVPWTPRTRQVEGRASEKRSAAKFGARVHPNSGAGKIKFDFSTEDAIFEHKDALVSHSLNARVLMDLFRKASRQGKDGVYVVRFANGITLTGKLDRELVE